MPEYDKGAKPEKSLLTPLKKKAGRGNTGRVTTRHQGGGSKRRYRIIDFKRDKFGIEGKVWQIEYDPNRGLILRSLCTKTAKNAIFWLLPV